MSAQNHQTARIGRQILRKGLRERTSVRRWKQEPDLLAPRFVLLTDLLYGAENRFRLHNHPGPAAIGHIVGNFVLIQRVVPEIVHLHVKQTLFLGPFEHTAPENRSKHLGKQGDYVTPHHVPRPTLPLCAPSSAAARDPRP